MSETAANPFRPGAGHSPPFLAGRDHEKEEFRRLLGQGPILTNLVLTGLRGTGKTVLLEELKPIAQKGGWLWIGTELSESSCVTEEHLAVRLITDLAVITSGVVVGNEESSKVGFMRHPERVSHKLDYEMLRWIYDQTPGLVADKLKHVLEIVWQVLAKDHHKGLVIAYDEAQTLSDHRAKEEYPLALLLDVFQSLQKRGVRILLLLTGLPTLFPKLVESRTFAERMFRVLVLDRLNERESREAILRPLETSEWTFEGKSVNLIVEASGGYPYFIQYICRDVYDLFAAGVNTVPIEEILMKLDSDFFYGRWARASDRQRDLLRVIASLEDCDAEFTVLEIVEAARAMAAEGRLGKPFGSSHVNQMLASMCSNGLVYKNRHGRYSFAVPLFGAFVRRQQHIA